MISGSDIPMVINHESVQILFYSFVCGTVIPIRVYCVFLDEAMLCFVEFYFYCYGKIRPVKLSSAFGKFEEE